MGYKIGKSPRRKKTKRFEFWLLKEKVIGYEYGFYKVKNIGTESKLVKVITNEKTFKVAKYDYCIIDNDEGIIK